MEVYLVRHAEAVPETLEVRDPHRPLSPHGRVQARGLGDRLRWCDCAPTQVWSSPLVRAVQTAELVTHAFDHDPGIEIVPALAPDGSPRDVAAALRALAPDASVVVVGHEPSLSAIGALVVGDPRFPALAKAQAARVADGTPRWVFAWDAEAPEPFAAR